MEGYVPSMGSAREWYTHAFHALPKEAVPAPGSQAKSRFRARKLNWWRCFDGAAQPLAISVCFFLATKLR